MNIKNIFKFVCIAIALILSVVTIGFFLYPLIKAFMLYQDGLQEQEAFSAVVVPLIGKWWITALVTGLLGTGALMGFFYLKKED